MFRFLHRIGLWRYAHCGPPVVPGACVNYVRAGMPVYLGVRVLETGRFGRARVALPGGGAEWLSTRKLFVVDGYGR
jgi:hypothetical protein